MKELLLILILILILAIFFYNCYLTKLIEGNTTSNKKIMAIGDTLAVGEFITSQSNGQLFGLFDDKIGIYTIPSNTTLQSQVSNEGLTQEFLTSTPVSEVEVSGAKYLKFNTSGIVVTDATSNPLWSIEMTGLTGGSTLILDDNGVLRKTGGGEINIETSGVEQDASGPVKVSVEDVLTNLISDYPDLNNIISTFYANVDPTALAEFRNEYNNIFVSGGNFTELQDWAYYYLSSVDDTDELKIAIKAAVIESNTYGTNSFCTNFSNESQSFTPIEIGDNAWPYTVLQELYNTITLNNPGIQDFIEEHVSNENPEISKDFIHNILKIGNTQAFLSLTGLYRVIKTVCCPQQLEPASSSETFINMSGDSNYKPFSGNVAFSLL